MDNSRFYYGYSRFDYETWRGYSRFDYETWRGYSIALILRCWTLSPGRSKLVPGASWAFHIPRSRFCSYFTRYAHHSRCTNGPFQMWSFHITNHTFSRASCLLRPYWFLILRIHSQKILINISQHETPLSHTLSCLLSATTLIPSHTHATMMHQLAHHPLFLPSRSSRDRTPSAAAVWRNRLLLHPQEDPFHSSHLYVSIQHYMWRITRNKNWKRHGSHNLNLLQWEQMWKMLLPTWNPKVAFVD